MTHPDDQPAAVIKRELWARLDEVMRPAGSMHETELGPTALGDWLGDRVYAALLEAELPAAVVEVHHPDGTVSVAVGEVGEIEDDGLIAKAEAERDNALAEVERLKRALAEAGAEADRVVGEVVGPNRARDLLAELAASIPRRGGWLPPTGATALRKALARSEADRDALAARLERAEKVVEAARLLLDAENGLGESSDGPEWEAAEQERDRALDALNDAVDAYRATPSASWRPAAPGDTPGGLVPGEGDEPVPVDATTPPPCNCAWNNGHAPAHMVGHHHACPAWVPRPGALGSNPRATPSTSEPTP